ncbi:hypothetical protein M408DRAFT_296343 [Serendipita vermifera MAFF 305830]|uniref:C2H2-type domain-containing protein n=1 Tax=Serendipita vermifera MAFF 305830 TaxID=933852 RepID=A0A0C3BDS6_SERVB|nr:hypothetical protein M408DRAFT_296343 [Serendipita vermifera MAFF 305830]
MNLYPIQGGYEGPYFENSQVDGTFPTQPIPSEDSAAIHPWPAALSTTANKQLQEPRKCVASDPALQALALDLIHQRSVYPSYVPPDSTIARFFHVETAPEEDRPKNPQKAKQRKKPLPGGTLRYQCLWCKDYIGYSKEKARDHLLADLGAKPFKCTFGECTFSTVRRYDLNRHVRFKHDENLPNYNRI